MTPADALIRPLYPVPYAHSSSRLLNLLSFDLLRAFLAIARLSQPRENKKIPLKTGNRKIRYVRCREIRSKTIHFRLYRIIALVSAWNAEDGVLCRANAIEVVVVF